MKKSEIVVGSYADYFKRYIDMAPERKNLIEALQDGELETIAYFEKLPEKVLDYAYEAEKWTPREIFQHLIDTERIFIYRCFRIARMDDTPLSSFDQEIYNQPSGAKNKPLTQLISEYSIQRKASISLIESLSDKQLQFIGNAAGGPMSAAAAAFVIVGHEIWHKDIIKEKYL